jgi:hypothetical protein
MRPHHVLRTSVVLISAACLACGDGDVGVSAGPATGSDASPVFKALGQTVTYTTRRAAHAGDNAAYDVLVTAGYADAGDGGSATYQKVAADTTSRDGDRGGFRDRDGADGGTWWELTATAMNVRAFGAAGDGVKDDASAINAAIAAAVEKTSGRVYLPSGTYAIASPIVLLPGARLVGDGSGVATNPAVRGTQIRAVADMPAMIRTDGEAASGPYAVENMLLHGNTQDEHAVENGLLLLGHDVRIASVDVSNVSGIAVHLLSAGAPPAPSPYNYVIVDSQISKNGMGIVNESAGAFVFMSDVENNDIGTMATHVSNTQRAMGGSVWLGNHIQTSHWYDTTALDVTVGPEYEGAASPDAFIGNSFQKSKEGIHVASVAGQKFSAPMILKDNWMSTSDADLHFERVRDVSVADMQVFGFIDRRHGMGIANQKAIVFSDVSSGVVEGLHASEDVAALVDGLPANVTVSRSTWKHGHHDATYELVERNPPGASTCIADGTRIRSGASRTFYSKLFALDGESCADSAAVRTCNAGVLSGPARFAHASCTTVPTIDASAPEVIASVYDAMPVTHATLEMARRGDNDDSVILKTAGYSANADGGGAVYAKVADADVEERGGFHDAKSHAWELLGWPYDVRWFGAKGDGVAFDDDAINAAIEAASHHVQKITGKAGGTGGAVYVPRGTYLVRHPVRLVQGTTLFGAGGSASILRAGADLASVLTTNNTNVISQPNTVMHVGIDGAKTSGRAVEAGIHVFGRSLRIANVAVDGVSGTGILMEGTSYEDGEDREPAWVNSVSRSRVSNSGTGFWTGSSDSFYWENAFIDNDRNESKLRGDAKWFGNRFVGGAVGLSCVFRLLDTYYDHSVDQILQNTFDSNGIGLRITSDDATDADGVAFIPEADYVIDGNTFMSDETGILFDHENGVTVAGSKLVAGPRTRAAIAFAGVEGGLIKGLTLIGNFPSVMSGKPDSVSFFDE